MTVGGVTPSNGRSIGGETITVNGQNFLSPTAGATSVFFGGTPASGLLILNDTTLSVTAPAAIAGSVVDVSISNDNGTSILFGAYRYNAAPAMTTALPSSGRSIGDTLITLQGSGFVVDAAGVNTVMIGGLPATAIVTLADDALQCKVPGGTPGSAVDIQVSNANGLAILSSGYRYNALPTLTSVSPASGSSRGGLQAVLQGSGFMDNNPGVNLISFGAAPATNVSVLSDGNLSCEVPAGTPGAIVNITLTNENGSDTLLGAFTYNVLPTIAALSVAEGPAQGDVFLSITGSGFLNNSAGTATVTFGGFQASAVTVLTDGELICSTPAGIAGTLVDVKVANSNGDATLIGGFRYNDLPAISSITPSNGSLNGSTFVLVTGSGFVNFNAGMNLVTFGGSPATAVTVANDTTLTCLSPIGTGGTTVDVRVTNNNGEGALLSAYTYDDGPTITSLLPAEGTTEGGTSVLIFGIGFLNASSGPANVTFGGVPAIDIQVLADTAVLCDTPVGNPGSVDVVISNDNGMATFPVAYTYVAPAPTLTGIAPSSGSSLGDTLLTLTGSGFANFTPGDNSILIGGIPATDVTILGDASLTCNVPAGTAGTLADVALANNNGTAELLSSFRYHSLPVLSSIAPNSGSALGGTSITMFGSGFVVDEAGTPTITFDGTPVTDIVVLGDTSLTCTAPSGAEGALADIRLENNNGPSAIAGAFRYHQAPTISSIIPPSGSSLGGTSLLIVGSGYSSDAAGLPTITIGGVVASEVTVLDDTGLTVTIPAGVAGARVTVDVTNVNGTALLPDGYRYHDLPVITAVTPSSGSPDGGDALLITGFGFQKDLAGTNSILIGGVPASSINVIDDTTLSCVTPPGTPGTFAEVRVSNSNGEVGMASLYRYNSRPAITSLTPTSGTSLGGVAITLSGSGFLDDNAGTNIVRFGGIPASNVTVLSDSTLSFTAPAGTPASSVDVTVDNDNGNSVLLSGFRFHAEPALISISPTSGASMGGISITVNGSGFLIDGASLNAVTFGGNPATDLVVVDDSTLTLTLPAGSAGSTVDLALLNQNGGDILPSAFTYNMPASLTSIVPASGSAVGGTQVTLLGAGFNGPGTGTNTILFGAMPATNVVTIDNTTLTCTIPSGTAGSAVDITLQNGNGTTILENGFLYYPRPTLTSITPATGSALGGTSVLFFGTGFLANSAGAMTVTFNGSPATAVNVFSDTAFLCTAPTGLPGQPVSVEATNSNGTATLSDAFTYSAPSPSVTAVNPPTGSPLGGTLVTLSGTGFSDFAPGSNLVTFGGVLATDVTVIDDMTLSCAAPAGIAGALVDVRIQNDNGADLFLSGFRFNTPPALTLVNPASGSPIGNVVINIEGLGFMDQNPGVTNVTVGGLAATNVVIVSDTMLTAMAPSGPAGGIVDVSVSNANGSDTLATAFRYHDLPTMALVAPNHGSAMGGDSLTLTGTGFLLNAAGSNSVTFDGAPASNVIVLDDTTLTCETPAGIAGGFATIEITNANGSVTTPIAFRFHAGPALASASPATGRSSGGTTILLYGNGFMVDNAGTNMVSIGGSPATNIMVFSDTALLCDTPAGLRDDVVDIAITNANGSSFLASAFTYTASTPVLMALAPEIGSSMGGTVVTLSGKDFLDPARGVTSVTIGGQAALNLSIIDDTTITVEIPAGTPGVLVDVVVSNDNGTATMLGAFMYSDLPTLTALLPDNGSSLGGDVVLLTGSGFVAGDAGANTVLFDGIPATLVTVLDDATLSVTTPVPATPGLVDVSVSNTNGQVLLVDGFMYRQAPTLASLSKLSGSSLGGEAMTLTGFEFEAVGAGATEVLFEGIAATDVVVVDDLEITCTIPTGTAGLIVDVEVRNDNGSSTLASAYRFHDLPTITDLTPSQGTMMGGSSVTITGTGFVNDAAGLPTVAFGGSPATSVTVYR